MVFLLVCLGKFTPTGWGLAVDLRQFTVNRRRWATGRRWCSTAGSWPTKRYETRSRSFSHVSFGSVLASAGLYGTALLLHRGRKSDRDWDWEYHALPVFSRARALGLEHEVQEVEMLSPEGNALELMDNKGYPYVLECSWKALDGAFSPAVHPLRTPCPTTSPRYRINALNVSHLFELETPHALPTCSGRQGPTLERRRTAVGTQNSRSCKAIVFVGCRACQALNPSSLLSGEIFARGRRATQKLIRVVVHGTICHAIMSCVQRTATFYENLTRNWAFEFVCLILISFQFFCDFTLPWLH